MHTAKALSALCFGCSVLAVGAKNTGTVDTPPFGPGIVRFNNLTFSTPSANVTSTPQVNIRWWMGVR